jgi:hypothetical protein
MTREDRGASSFDELASGLASGSISRGKALRLMGAALVGGALGSLGMREAGADLCKRAGKACKKNSQCCSGNCVNAPTGTCAVCPSGQVLCGGNCVSNSCDPGQTFNTTNCQCEPTGPASISCTCGDNTHFGPLCRPTDCSMGVETLAFCTPLCESHGGVSQTSCASNACA